MPRDHRGHYLSDRPNKYGFYEICWTEGGRSKRLSTGEADRRAATRFFAQAILAKDHNPIDPAITFDMVADAYLTDKLRTVVDVKGLKKTFGHLRTHFGHMTISEISEDDCLGYAAARGAGLISFEDEAGRQRGKGLVRGGKKAGGSTVRGELVMLGTAVDYCIKRRKFRARDGIPMLKPSDRPLIDLPPASPPRDRWLSRDEAQRLLAACQPDPKAPLTRVYRYVAMLLYTGSRKQPVHTLPWDRISMSRWAVNFQDPGRAVTKKRRGWVPLAAEFQPIVQRAYEERSTDWWCDTPAEPRHLFYDAVARAGLTDVSPHVLRHTWATWAAQDGVPLGEIAAVLHDTVSTVERRYIHHCPQHLRGAVDRPLLVPINGGRARSRA
jgi:integrase